MLKLRKEKIKDGVILHCIGRIIEKDRDKFKKILNKVEGNLKLKRIVVDLTEVEFIDSTAVGQILYFHAVVTKNEEVKREFILVNANTHPFHYVKRIAELFGMEKIVPMYKSIEDYDEPKNSVRKKNLDDTRILHFPFNDENFEKDNK